MSLLYGLGAATWGLGSHTPLSTNQPINEARKTKFVCNLTFDTRQIFIFGDLSNCQRMGKVQLYGGRLED